MKKFINGLTIMFGLLAVLDFGRMYIWTINILNAQGANWFLKLMAYTPVTSPPIQLAISIGISRTEDTIFNSYTIGFALQFFLFGLAQFLGERNRE